MDRSNEVKHPPRQRLGWVFFGGLLGIALIVALWWLAGVILQNAGDLGGNGAQVSSLVSVSHQLGIDQLEALLGDKTPTGRDIVTAHVESRTQEAYLPPLHATRFRGVAFLPRSGPSPVSGHASATATIIYGPKGLAPGISQVNCYATPNWLGRGFLHMNSAQPPEIAWPTRLVTCSWISHHLQPADDVLLRVDHVVNQQGVVFVVAVDNGATTLVPPVLAGAFNVIAVGNWDGSSSGGRTVVPKPGRCKPDLVAPGGLTSFATPAVAALAARLLERADTLGVDRSIEPMVIKAILMAGADKPADWTATPTHPLDNHYGAGRPRLDHSDAILIHQLKDDLPPRRTGWDHRTLSPDQSLGYRLDVNQPIHSLSAVVLWQRRVTSKLTADPFSRQLRLRYTGQLADLDLALNRGEGQDIQLIASSVSRVDNVEHIYARNLPAGRYDLVVKRHDKLKADWDYVIAWRVVLQSEFRSQALSPQEDVR